MKTKLLITMLLMFCTFAIASEKSVNVYTWGDEIPASVITQFEQETGITVNLSSFDSNEMLYAKLKTTPEKLYDVIQPSSYYVERMAKEGMLQKIDKYKLKNIKNINSLYLNKDFDPVNQYSIPYASGITGIFLNSKAYPQLKIKGWTDLWNKGFKNQLLMPSDQRSLFSIAFKKLNYPLNNTNPRQIKAAYLILRELAKNVRVYADVAATSLIIDEDVKLGVIWNDKFVKAFNENDNLKFIFPEEGIQAWMDNYAIPQQAPHPENAYKFIDFMLRAEIAKKAAVEVGYGTTNLAAWKLLPKAIKKNKILYPSMKIILKAEFERNIPNDALALYQHYWELLRMM